MRCAAVMQRSDHRHNHLVRADGAMVHTGGAVHTAHSSGVKTVYVCLSACKLIRLILWQAANFTIYETATETCQ